MSKSSVKLLLTTFTAAIGVMRKRSNALEKSLAPNAESQATKRNADMRPEIAKYGWMKGAHLLSSLGLKC
jgi:hypothetical protein